MDVKLEAMALDVPEVKEHPNRLPFRGVLTLVGATSSRPPHGAKGHRVMLSHQAVAEALPSLLGMALDYTPSLDGHDARRKIGLITEANVVPAKPGRAAQSPAALEVAGYLYAHDFADVVEMIRAGSNDSLGMSYEIAQATVPRPDAAIWTVTSFTFTGAAVLQRDRAAYSATWFALAAEPAE